ncbi:MAG: hypothetical protein EOO24_16495 [Comamonadaceae bacterium]|nr:MAG: hypothetical protein EOO24_16495 [Comamonadaceae bacterium]
MRGSQSIQAKVRAATRRRPTRPHSRPTSIIRGLFVTFVQIPPGAPRVTSNVPSSASAAAQTPLESELAQVLVEALNLDIAPADIDPLGSLFGDGLGLDSIDILELALEISRRYGFQLRSDDERNKQIFESLRSLSAHVAANRAA